MLRGLDQEHDQFFLVLLEPHQQSPAVIQPFVEVRLFFALIAWWLKSLYHRLFLVICLQLLPPPDPNVPLEDRSVVVV